MHRSDAVLLCLGFRLQKHDARCILLCFNRSRNEVLGTFHRARLLHKSPAGCLNLCVILLWVLLLWAWMTEVRPLGFLQWGQLLEGAQSHHDGFSSKPSLLLNRKCLLLLPLIAASVLAWRCTSRPVCRLPALLLASRDAEQYAPVRFGWLQYSPQCST